VKHAWCAALLLAASCARCGAGTSAPDAGPLVHRSIDLRTATLTAMPEFRDTRLLSGSAVLRRTLEGDPRDLEAATKRAVANNGWKEEPKVAGSKVLAAGKDPFRLEVEPTARGAELRLSMPIKDGDPMRFLGAPISITTEQLALYLPRPEGMTVMRERFEVSLEYTTIMVRAHFLVWQVVDLSTRGAWKLARVPEGFEVSRKEDGGIGDVPERVSLMLEDSATTARLSVDRDGKTVKVEYQLDTLGPPLP
jgi:hypothetical protein